MVITDFQMKNKVDRPKFFQEIFFVADTHFEMVLRISFLKISNTDVLFDETILT